MCGISGGIELHGQSLPIKIVERIVTDQKMRGPDATSIDEFQIGNHQVALGHNRLSILDLSNRANQPMWDETHRYGLVFNGEIYNYLEIREELIAKGCEFTTASDTEVLLRAMICWGKEAVQKFNGMFAFAFIDKVKQKILLVRDRFGVKPLFYYEDDDRLYFASTARALAPALQCKPNLQYAKRGLDYGIYEDDTGFSPYENLEYLPAGTFKEFDFSENKITGKISKYYNFFEAVQQLKEELLGLSNTVLLEKVKSLLQSSITLRLRSDVPVGVSISGGLDSTTLAAFILDKQDSLTGFTLGEKNNSFSEGPLVELFSKTSGLHVNYIWPKIDDINKAFWKTMYDQDAPFRGGSAIAQNQIFKAVNEQKIKVIIGGQGGDEAFMGYRKFFLFYFNSLLEQGKYLSAASFFCKQIPMFMSESRQINKYWYRRTAYMKQPKTRSNLILEDGDSFYLGKPSDMSMLERQCLDVTRYSIPTLLRYEDRNSMGNSVETRLPFLDYRLMELGVALPICLKLKNGHGKFCLREIAKNYVPDDIRLDRRKRGFPAPDEMWLKEGLAQDIYQKLSDSWSKIQPFLSDKQTFENTFSPRQIIERPGAFRESITLCWLSGIYRYL
ncbi:MAG: asparagine synthase (glutamine-hydrolyzing) [Alphaproteobacteria bacterium]|nr:MAG: asparagine synthase (glutamine-hydrolyzing) [Alphaproteobacteria bacterium]